MCWGQNPRPCTRQACILSLRYNANPLNFSFFFLKDEALISFIAQVGLKMLYSSDPTLPSSWDYRYMLLCSSLILKQPINRGNDPYTDTHKKGYGSLLLPPWVSDVPVNLVILAPQVGWSQVGGEDWRFSASVAPRKTNFIVNDTATQ